MSEQSTPAAMMNGSAPARGSETTNRPFDLSQYQDPRVIQRLLHTAKTIAIVGLSADPLRPSNFVGFYLQRHGYRIIPVNPRRRRSWARSATPRSPTSPSRWTW